MGARYPRLVAALIAAASAAATAQTSPAPFGFAQAFDAAIANDAQFRAARHERDSTQLNVPLARAQLLPSVSLSVSDSQTRGTREFPNVLNQLASVNVDYASPQASLQLRAPIFNWDSISRYRQALRQSDAADAVFRVRGAELVERLGTAYLQVLLVDENIRQVKAQITALEAQRQRAEQRLARGEGSRIEVSDVASQLAVAGVRLTDLQDQARVARRALSRLTGVEVELQRALPPDFTAPPLVPAQLEDWLMLARSRNAVIQVREQQIEVARLGVERSKAGHYPRLDAVASVSQSTNESISNLNQSSRLASVGLQLSVPIFSGFGVEAGINQARTELAKAEADLANERENVAVEVQRHFLAVSAGQARLRAMAESVAANELVLEGVTRGQTAGLRTLSEVQDAIARVFAARRELAQARLDYLLSRLRLHLQSGAALAEAVFDVERLLGGQP